MTETFTTADREMIAALAATVAADRMARAEVADGTDGKTRWRFVGEPTDAEKMWFGLMAKLAAEPRTGTFAPALDAAIALRGGK